MEKDILQRNCRTVINAKYARKKPDPRQHSNPCLSYRHPIKEFTLIFLDHLKTSEKGKKFILVITDAFTKYIELVPTVNKEAETITEAIFNNWICRYGIPAELSHGSRKRIYGHRL